MNTNQQILTILYEEMEKNHFHVQTHDWLSFTALSSNITTHDIEIHDGYISITTWNRLKGQNTHTVKKFQLSSPKSIGAVLSYLHRNCIYGRDTRNRIGYDPHRTPS